MSCLLLTHFGSRAPLFAVTHKTAVGCCPRPEEWLHEAMGFHGDINDVIVSLRLVLQLERVPSLPR
jgi:hypothetical protein